MTRLSIQIFFQLRTITWFLYSVSLSLHIVVFKKLKWGEIYIKRQMADDGGWLFKAAIISLKGTAHSADGSQRITALTRLASAADGKINTKQEPVPGSH